MNAICADFAAKKTARREALRHAVQRYLGERVELTGDGSGVPVALWPTKRLSEDTAIARAAARGVGVYGISPFFLTPPLRAAVEPSVLATTLC